MAAAIRFIQADDPDAWQRTLLTLCLPACDASAVDAPLVVVPSRAAADQWRRSIEQRLLIDGWTPSRALQAALEHAVDPVTRVAVGLPRLVTREELLETSRRAARIEAPRLAPMVRDVIMGASAREAARIHRPPFRIRPGLVAEMIGLFDRVDRLGHDPEAWLADVAVRLADEAGTDRGAARLLQQTRFLARAFAIFAARLTDAGGLDDRGLRRALAETPRRWSPAHVIVTVGDHHADASGLWPVDLAMIASAPGLVRLDVVATRGIAAQVFPRLRRLWPGASEVRVSPQRPAETRLEVTSPEHRWIACRDRDDEVLAYARRVKARARAGEAPRSALVYRRPLPYLYVAHATLSDAGVPFSAAGMLPLASEPWAAALDLVMDVALSGFTRAALVSLLRSPHVALHLPDGTRLGPDAVGAFDTWLARQRYLGTLEHLDALLAQPSPRLAEGVDTRGRRAEAVRQAHLARAVGTAVRPWLAQLTPLQAHAPAARHVGVLRAAWASIARPPLDDDPEVARTRPTRAALDLLLAQLEEALARHDETPVPARETCLLVRRWIEEQTFALPGRDDGVVLIDAEAAAYGMFDHVRLVGLLEGEWPEPSARDIFYPAFLLEPLGWPEERARTAALRARLGDLLALPSEAVGVSVPELDQDAVVRPSSLLDELASFGDDRLVHVPADESTRPVTGDEALLASPVVPDAPVLSDEARDWATWRVARPRRRTDGETAIAHVGAFAVTAVETYLQCPFKYFAAYVLGLEEAAEDEPGLPAREAGLLLHDVLHDGFAAWARAGHVGVGLDDLPAARATFGIVAERALATLAPADRPVERARLFGSAVASGAIEKILRLEVERFGDVRERSLELDLDQSVTFEGPNGPRTLRLRGRVDRVDWTHDGRIRVIDYKVGRRPSEGLQPGVYGLALVQREAHAGRTVTLAPSGFVAFREDPSWIEAVTVPDDAAALASSMVDAVEGIDAGTFPVKPSQPFRCQFCAFPGVCRKDYVGDE